MAAERFTSFHSRDVLPALEATFPQWANLFAMTADILRNPYTTTGSADDYRREVFTFFAWALEILDALA